MIPATHIARFFLQRAQRICDGCRFTGPAQQLLRKRCCGGWRREDVADSPKRANWVGEELRRDLGALRGGLWQHILDQLSSNRSDALSDPGALRARREQLLGLARPNRVAEVAGYLRRARGEVLEQDRLLLNRPGRRDELLERLLPRNFTIGIALSLRAGTSGRALVAIGDGA